MSKSEILSLSVLEFLSVGTKSLVNVILNIKNISKLLYFAKPNAGQLQKKLNEIVDIRENSVNKRKIFRVILKNLTITKFQKTSIKN